MNLEIDDCSEFDVESTFVLQLIMNTNLLSHCRDIIKPNLASNKYTEHVLRWLLEYYDATGKAPKNDITSIFIANRTKISEDEAENVEILLQNLGDDYEVNNTEHNAKNIIDYFNWRKLSLLQEDLKQANKMKDITRGLSLINSYTEIAKTKSDSYNPFRDTKETFESFTNDNEVVLRMQGALGSVLGDFVRGDTIGMVAKQKSGKSMVCLHIMEEAINQGKNVLYFNLEIAKRQMNRRVWQRFNRIPKKTGDYEIPYFDGQEIAWKKTTVEEKHMRLGFEEIKKRASTMRRQKQGKVEIVTFPRTTATLNQLKNKTQQLEKEMGFVPDLIIIDNPDCMDYKETNNENKDEENLWAKISGWAEIADVCIFAPTHGNRKSFSGKGFGIDGLGGSYGKLKSVGKMFQLSMSPEEKSEGYATIKMFEGTERDESSTYGRAIVLVALDFCQWGLDSRLEKEVTINMV